MLTRMALAPCTVYRSSRNAEVHARLPEMYVKYQRHMLCDSLQLRALFAACLRGELTSTHIGIILYTVVLAPIPSLPKAARRRLVRPAQCRHGTRCVTIKYR